MKKLAGWATPSPSWRYTILNRRLRPLDWLAHTAKPGKMKKLETCEYFCCIGPLRCLPWFVRACILYGRASDERDWNSKGAGRHDFEHSHDAIERVRTARCSRFGHCDTDCAAPFIQLAKPIRIPCRIRLRSVYYCECCHSDRNVPNGRLSVDSCCAVESSRIIER